MHACGANPTNTVETKRLSSCSKLSPVQDMMATLDRRRRTLAKLLMDTLQARAPHRTAHLYTLCHRHHVHHGEISSLRSFWDAFPCRVQLLSLPPNSHKRCAALRKVYTSAGSLYVVTVAHRYARIAGVQTLRVDSGRSGVHIYILWSI